MFSATPLQMPSLSNFFSGGILEGLKNLFEFITTFFSDLAVSLQHFYGVLTEINSYVRDWTAAFGGGMTNLPVFASVGAYRYLVGEGAFYITYIMIVSGCLFTIFRLIYILYCLVEKLTKKALTQDKKTASGILSVVEKFLS